MYPVEPTTRTFISLGFLFLKEADEAASEIPASKAEIGLNLSLLNLTLPEESWVGDVIAKGSDFT